MRTPASQAALLGSKTGRIRQAWAEVRELAFIWVQALPRLWQVARFTGGVLGLIALKRIRRTLGHSGTIPVAASSAGRRSAESLAGRQAGSAMANMRPMR